MPVGGGKIIIIKVYTLIWARETERRDERVMQERLKKKKGERDVQRVRRNGKMQRKKIWNVKLEAFEEGLSYASRDTDIYIHDAALLVYRLDYR